MVGSGGGVSIARARGENRFYNPPAIRQRQLEQQKRHQLQQQQRQQEQQQNPAPLAAEPKVLPAESDKRTAANDFASSFCSVSARGEGSNLDRFLEYTTPVVSVQYLSKSSTRQRRTQEPKLHPYFVLGDLWESFKEWSAYGAGVPLLLNGSDSVMQYYVPYLSGIQLYIDPSKPFYKLRKPGDESDAESSRETSSGGSSDYGAERGFNNAVNGAWIQNTTDPNIHGWKGVSSISKPSMESSSDESETCNPPGRLMFEYLAQDPPYSREPLADKISVLSSQFPELRTYRSCDLSPSSWISVAWYPIYRIPTGPTLQNLEACFLTFHSLSTPSHGTSTDWLHFEGARPREVQRAISKLSLPLFGLASYKSKVPFWNPNGVDECLKASSLLQAADNWLRLLQVSHPDYSFFASHHSPRR